MLLFALTLPCYTFVTAGEATIWLLKRMRHPTFTGTAAAAASSVTPKVELTARALTSLVPDQNVSVVQIFHLLRVVLRVGGVGARISRFGPANFSESFRVDFERLHADLSRDVDDHPPRDAVPAGEDGHVAVMETVVAHREALHLSEHHGGQKQATKKK